MMSGNLVAAFSGRAMLTLTSGSVQNCQGITRRDLIRIGSLGLGGLALSHLLSGGLKTGQVIGQSDQRAAFPAGSAYTPQNLLATIMHTLFDLGEVRITPGLPTELVQRITAAPPIAELV
jgi:hypothetical protein